MSNGFIPGSLLNDVREDAAVEVARDETIERDACAACMGYLDRRSRKIARPMAEAAAARGISIAEVAVAYMVGVHARHLAGLPI